MMRRHLAVAAVVFSLAAASFAATDGTRVAPFRLGATDVEEHAVGAIANGNGFAVITLRSAPASGGPAQIRYTPIDLGGHPIVSQARALVSSPGPTLFAPGLSVVRLSDSGAGAALAWFDGDAVTVASLSRSGDLGTPHVIGHGKTDLGFGCNASRCVAAWYDPAMEKYQAAVTDPAGNVLIDGLTASGYYATSDPGGVLLVAYNRVMRVDTTTGAISFDVTFAPNVFVSAADFDGQSYTVLWTSYDGEHHINAAKVSLNGALSSPKIVRSSDRPFAGVNLIWNGSEHLLAFGIDDVDGPAVGGIPEFYFPTNVYVQRLNAALEPISDGVRVTNNAEANAATDMAWNGSTYFVTYDDKRTDTYFGLPASARGALLSAQAGVLANDVIAIGPLSQRTPVLASSGDVRFAAWVETDRTNNAASLRAARLRRDGTRIDETSIEIASAKAIVLSQPNAAADAGDDFLVAWREQADLVSEGIPAAAIIRSSGAVERIALPFGPTANPVKVASNGSSWLVVSLSTQQQLSAVRIARSGQLLNPQPISLGQASTFDVASDGSGFAVLRAAAPSSLPCTECAPRLLTVLDANGAIVAADVLAANGGLLSIAGGRGGFLVFAGDDRARLFDGSGRASASSVRLGPRGSIADIEPFGNGWLIWFSGFLGSDFLAQIDANATTVLKFSDATGLQALTANDDGSVTQVFARADELPPNGFGAALVMRDLAPPIPPRRRAAR